MKLKADWPLNDVHKALSIKYAEYYQINDPATDPEKNQLFQEFLQPERNIIHFFRVEKIFQNPSIATRLQGHKSNRSTGELRQTNKQTIAVKHMLYLLYYIRGR